MKSYFKKKGIVKGTPSAVLISLAVHAGLFLLAGLFVVFTVIDKPEPKFEPPLSVERPKMKLKKPQVRLKKTSKPKATAKIVTKVNRATMPEIQLPEMSGIGDGLAGGLGGDFGIMPNLEEVTMFGSDVSIGNDFEGVFYDLKRYRDGRMSSVFDADSLKDVVEKFIRSDWSPGTLSRYYVSPRKLYTPMIMVPPTESSLGPWAFGERDMDPWTYLLHYKGQLTHKKGIKFRFVVMGDNYLLIRLNGKVVMDYKNQFESAVDGPSFKPLSYHLGHWYAYGSDWIEILPGVPQDIEMIMGDYAGGLAAFMVAVEEYGKEYPTAPSPQDNPVLPILKTSRLSADHVDAIYKQMWDGHLDVYGGPVFNDYDSENQTTNATLVAVAPAEPAPADSLQTATSGKQSALRVWSFKNGTSVEAEYLSIMGGMVVLKTPSGKIHKLAPSEFSTEDSDLLSVMNPPKLKMEFKKDTKSYQVKSNPLSNNPIPTVTDFTGTAMVEQQERADYPRPLRLEFYVIADEYDGNNFILLDRNIADFTLTPENNRQFKFRGSQHFMLRFEDYGGHVRGEKYMGYMILVYNERDELIAQNLSQDWFLGLRDTLLNFPVGRHFNKDGDRVYPPRPKFTDRYWDAGAESD